MDEEVQTWIRVHRRMKHHGCLPNPIVVTETMYEELGGYCKSQADIMGHDLARDFAVFDAPLLFCGIPVVTAPIVMGIDYWLMKSGNLDVLGGLSPQEPEPEKKIKFREFL